MAATRLGGLLAALALLAAVPACTQNCVPERLANPRNLIDLSAPPDAHASPSPGLIREVAATFQHRGDVQTPPGARPYHILALSSGGLYGSFGVGVLKGWTESGTRPTFDVVCGVSIGAVMATSAFLGPQYDGVLRDNLVDSPLSTLLRRRSLPVALLLGSLYSSRQLAERLEKTHTPEVLAEVARAHAAGRRLYIATTALDSGRPVIWDMGEIASRGTQEALILYRKIVLASASVPGAFPPVRLPIEIDGKRYEEWHVDGAASTEVFFRPFMVGDLNRVAGFHGALAPPGSTLYIISNGKLFPSHHCVRGLFGALSASTTSIISNKTRDELFRIYLHGMETGVSFRLTAVPQDLPVDAGALNLSVEDQKLLYSTGYLIGRHAPEGEHWRDAPPEIDPAEQVLPRSGTHFNSKAESCQGPGPTTAGGPP
jgi:Patatin-like phospholipase